MGVGLICNPYPRITFMSPNIHIHTYTCTHVYTHIYKYSVKNQEF